MPGTTALAANSFKHLSGSDYSTYQMERNLAYLEFWAAHIPDPDVNSRELVELISTETGMSRPEVKSNLRVATMLRNMPRLHESALRDKHLCERRLRAIEKQVCGITDPEVWRKVDEAITARLSPQAPDEALIQPAAITLHVRDIVAEIDPPAASDKPDRTKRTAAIKRGDDGYTRFSINAPDSEALEIRQFLDKVLTKMQNAEYRAAKAAAREPQHFNLLDALLDVVRNNTHAKVHFNLIQTAGGVLHLNGAGPLVGSSAQTWIERAQQRTLDTRASVDKYTPSEEIRTATELLDGHCRFPGCDVPAIFCEKDHREEFDEGGETSVDNVYNLCSYHHHGKTERHYYYEAGPDRELTWYFKNGTTKTTYPQGPAVPRHHWGATWAQTEKSRTTRRREKSRK